MPSNTERLPWHDSQWQLLKRALQNDTVPHALLLHGPEGLGKKLFMQRLTQALLCRDSQLTDGDLAPCGCCSSCRQQSEDGSHPDSFCLRLEEGDREIKIDKARAAIHFTGLTAHFGGRKVIQIYPADKLSQAAANALLKTLEEPTPNTVILLITSKPAMLLPTIRSRCQQIRFMKPDAPTALDWLKSHNIDDPASSLAEAAGLPLKAKQLVDDNQTTWRQQRDNELRRFLLDERSPSRLAEHWLQFDQEEIQSWLYDRIRRLHWFYSGVATSIESLPHIKALTDGFRIHKMETVKPLLDSLVLMDKNNINKQLKLESLLIHLAQSSTRLQGNGV